MWKVVQEYLTNHKSLSLLKMNHIMHYNAIILIECKKDLILDMAQQQNIKIDSLALNIVVI